MTSSNYRDPATMEEAMREIRHLRKVDKKFDELRTENASLLAANRDSMDHYNELRAEFEKLIRQQEPVAHKEKKSKYCKHDVLLIDYCQECDDEEGGDKVRQL